LISVCIPAFNGALYIGAQLESILVSPLVTEVIVSDDGSSDNTVEVVKSYNDARIKLVQGPRAGLISNYELLLSLASGEYIFLADQDDVWMADKVEVMLTHLRDADFAVCDCTVVDAQLNLLYPSFFALRHSGPGLVHNLLRNSYLGCCIAMRRELLEYALPFPSHLPMHDWWLGLVAETFGRVTFIRQSLMMYRRHGGNASPTTERSRVAWGTRLYWRAILLSALIYRRFNLKKKIIQKKFIRSDGSAKR
jgi:glycosyltransferase involved in cell wall biosynthesis